MSDDRPWPPDILKAYLRSKSERAGEESLSRGAIGALIGHLQDICGSEDRRRLFLRYVYGTDTSLGLFADQWLRLREWLKPSAIAPEHGGKDIWTIDQHCAAEARLVIRAQLEADHKAKIDAGQATLPGL